MRAARDPLDNELREVSRTDKETGKNDQPGGKDHGKRPDSGQPAKTARLDIHEERTLAVDDGPEGSRFIGHRAFTVQDLRIGPQNTLFLLERGATPDGRVLTAACPPELGGPHFGPGLRAFILYQHHHCHVKQPKLHSNCANGASSSPSRRSTPCWHLVRWPSRLRRPPAQNRPGGQFGHHRRRLRRAPPRPERLRHRRQRPTCAWLGSADSKSRVGFLTHLRDGPPSYLLNDIALGHLQKQGLKAALVERLQRNPFAGDDWAAYLDRPGICDERHRRIATEAGLLGGLVAKGIHPMLAIVSDGAGQFDILEHGLCWVHTERFGAQADSVERGPAGRTRTPARGNLGLLRRSQGLPGGAGAGGNRGADRAI